MRTLSPTRTVPAVLVGLAISLTGGCGSDAVPSPTDSGEALATVVSLGKAGEGPLQALRLKNQVGTSTVTLSTKIGLDLNVDGRKVSTGDVPAILLDVTFRTTEVLPDGSAKATFSYDNARLAPGSAPNNELAAGLKAIEGITGSVTVTDRGAITDSDVTLPDSLPSTVRQTLDGLEEQLSQLAVPLPEEPVGVGATWSATNQLELSGLRTSLTTTYTLTALTADTFTVRFSYVQKIPAQNAAIPGLPDGTKAKARNSLLTGSGTSTVALTGLVPSTSTAKAGGTLRFALTQDGKTVDLIEVLQLDLGIKATS